MDGLVIREEPVSPTSIAEYVGVPIAFEVRSRLSIADLPKLVEVAETPWVKDYDAIEPPTRWPMLFDASNWVAISAWCEGERVGGAVVARDTNGVDMLEGRSDLAVLWDIRVHRAWRGVGVGRRLFNAAVDLARKNRCTELKVETQDINVGACRFYAAMGCTIASVDPEAYERLQETQILWRLALTR